jgi:hypothetical protein
VKTAPGWPRADARDAVEPAAAGRPPVCLSRSHHTLVSNTPASWFRERYTHRPCAEEASLQA